MMARSTWHIQYQSRQTIVSLVIFSITFFNVITQIAAQIEKQPWYEQLPAVAMDYKVHLAAGKEDCYYQYVQPGATLYVSFQVMTVPININIGRHQNIHVPHFAVEALQNRPCKNDNRNNINGLFLGDPWR